MTLGQWTVEWWRWAMSIPRAKNPVLDRTGNFADIGQPAHVWFLAGVFGGQEQDFPNRYCSVPTGVSILFPVINCEANSVEYPNLKTHDDLFKHVSADLSSIVKKDCYIDSVYVEPCRIRSDPEVFTLNISKDLDGLDCGANNVPCVADGYWVFLKPLPTGTYRINFAGSCENGRLNAGAHYEVKIM
jgi:hypothetical protein